MAWLILTIILGIVGIGALVFAATMSSTPSERAWGAAISTVCGLAWLIMTFFLCIHSVGQRQVGIVYNFSGTIAGKKDPGVVMTWPWQHIKTENVAIQKDLFVFDENNAAVSKDQQPITAVLVVNYQVQPADVISLYKKVGPSWKTVLLDGRVPQDFKETTAQFTSPQMTLNRPKLRTITLSRLRRELSPYDIRVVDVFVNNIGFSPAYRKAIEDKQVQVQAALRAQAKVAQAKAEAEQRVAAARGEAEAIALKGKALRNNPEILRLSAIEKLNPHAEVIFCSHGDCPTILGSLGTGSNR